MSERTLHCILIKVADKSTGPNQSFHILSYGNLTATIAVSQLSKNRIGNTELIKFHILALSRKLMLGQRELFFFPKNTAESYFKKKKKKVHQCLLQGSSLDDTRRDLLCKIPRNGNCASWRRLPLEIHAIAGKIRRNVLGVSLSGSRIINVSEELKQTILWEDVQNG